MISMQQVVNHSRWYAQVHVSRHGPSAAGKKIDNDRTIAECDFKALEIAEDWLTVN